MQITNCLVLKKHHVVCTVNAKCKGISLQLMFTAHIELIVEVHFVNGSDTTHVVQYV